MSKLKSFVPTNLLTGSFNEFRFLNAHHLSGLLTTCHEGLQNSIALWLPLKVFVVVVLQAYGHGYRVITVLSAKPKNSKTLHPDEEPKLRLPDSIARPITNMPLSRMENTTFVKPSIIDFHDMGLRTVLTVHGERFNSCQVIYSQFGLAIHKNDHQARRRFVEWAQNEIAVVPDFHKRILFSDEAHLWLNGYVNKQNCRIWSEANPQVSLETPLHPEKLTVWCALWAGGILLQKR
ncbi:transposase [Trichonephila clavipes]|nr:transposase [Trichonephila clavipes]